GEDEDDPRVPARRHEEQDEVRGDRGSKSPQIHPGVGEDALRPPQEGRHAITPSSQFRDERPLLIDDFPGDLGQSFTAIHMKKTGCEPRSLFSCDVSKAHGLRGLKRSPKACRATCSAAVTGPDGKRAVAAKKLLERRTAALGTNHLALFGVTYPDVKLLAARLAAKNVRGQPCTSSPGPWRNLCRVYV